MENIPLGLVVGLDALYTIDTLCAEPLTVTDPDEGETVYPETDPTVYE